MKKVASYIIIAALAFTFGNSLVNASEISGTISTDGSNSPTQTPNPSGGSDAGGDLAGNVSGGTDATTNTGNANTGGVNINAPLDPDFLPGGRLAGGGSQSTSASTEAASTTGISDEEMARLALINFGPRFGVPGAPDAGGGSGFSGGGGYEQLTVAPEINPVIDEPSVPTSVAYLPSPGAGTVSDDSNFAAAITNASGLSMPQLVLIALLGLILLASMGYAISRTGNTRSTAV